jgi:alkanesulfonate monooxygenase SsuD/methylene tetrahydromethanopterin reductase-like flavin-dependent oxidoreductase (luciferase family)
VSERGLDVLVVDDEGPALADLARQLRSLPETAAVHTAADGQEALRTLAERPFDAVFLDVRMPGIDGLELARVLRRFETPPAVVFVSAHETGAVGAFELKALDYLMKPVSRRRLAEAIALIRRLWTEERVDFDGEYYRAVRATVYDRPAEPLPVYVAASGPLAARLAGRVGDGFICTSGKGPALYDELLAKVAEGAEAADRDAGSIARMIEVKVSYDRDPVAAERACEWWAALALSGDEKAGVEDPIEMERLADAARDRASSRFIVSADPEAIVAGIAPYVELGFTELVFHFPGGDQRRAIDEFAADVLPLLRARWG